MINRGRDIAPMLAEFGSKLKQYDYICHVQSKKSLYNGGKTTGWREYLLDSLFGSELNIRRIFKAFKDQSQLGIALSSSLWSDSLSGIHMAGK